MAKIRKPNEIEIPKTVCGLVYGQPGTGKTTLSVSAPSPILIDAENGVHRIDAKHRCDTLQVDNFNDIMSTIPQLSEYKTVVFDTINEVIVHIENHLIKTNPKTHQSGKMNQYGYGLRSLEFKNMINRIKHLGKNVIFVAHDIEAKDTNGDKEIRPDISGKASSELMKFMDFVGYVEMLGKKRTISFTPCSKYYAKNSLGLDDFIEIPNVMNCLDVNDFLTVKIINPTIERRKAEQADFGKYQEIIDKGINIIAENDVNAALKLVSELSVIDDSKKVLWGLLVNKAESLTMVYNSAEKRFVSKTGEQVKPEPVKEEDPNAKYAEMETGVPEQKHKELPETLDEAIVQAEQTTEEIFKELQESSLEIPTDPKEIRKSFQKFCASKGLTTAQLPTFAKANGLSSEKPEGLAEILKIPDKLEVLIKEFLNKKAT